MRNLLLTALAVLFLGTFAACDSFVEDVENPIDSIGDEQLDSESQIPFAINGVRTRFATTHDQAALLSAGLSDEMIFDDRVPNATFPTYRQLDEGTPTLDNNSVDGLYGDLGELRFFSDKLVERTNALGDFEDAALKEEALFTGHFFGGVARFFFAAYFGLTEQQGGGVINAGPFIPASEMYALALADFDSALAHADAYEARVVNSAIARIHLYQGNYAQARTYATQGLQEGDPAFQSLHSVESDNAFYFGAGRGRTQFVAAFRYADYVAENPAEAARIPLFVVMGNDGTDTTPATTFYEQDKYGRSTPIDFISWQEVQLMLAELDLRDGNAASALGRINTVRASHGLDPLQSADMDVLLEERDKELWLTGQRLIDERRFNIWHLGPNTWRYMPITERERNANENL